MLQAVCLCLCLSFKTTFQGLPVGQLRASPPSTAASSGLSAIFLYQHDQGVPNPTHICNSSIVTLSGNCIYCPQKIVLSSALGLTQAWVTGHAENVCWEL